MRDSPDTAAELRTRALRLLARREHSRAELARKLARHATDAAALAQLLDALAARGQLSDARYAQERARQLGRRFGAERIRHDLIAKGIDALTASRLAAEAGAGDLERARALLARKYRGAASTPQERARRMRFLQGRGFGHEVVRRALSSSDPE